VTKIAKSWKTISLVVFLFFLGDGSLTQPSSGDAYIPLPIAGETEYRLTDVIGQLDLTQSAFHTITERNGMHMGGVHVHKYSDGSLAMYVYDSGNNRILAFLNPDWTSPETRPNRVFGQNDSFRTGACNGDNNYLSVQPTARSLCINSGAFQISQEEEPKFASMDTDANGNLYVIDQHNSRVLMFLDPFGNGPNSGDTTADVVWGQSNFNTKGCNRGAGTPSVYGHTLGSDRVCTTNIPHFVDPMSAVSLDIDPWGNMWVTDTMNNRVLRFPFNPQYGHPDLAADIVLGQPNMNLFYNNYWSCETQPPGVGFCALFYLKIHDATGELYVMHHWEDPRIWVFKPDSTVNNPTAYQYSHSIGHDKLVWANYFTFIDGDHLLITDTIAPFHEVLRLFSIDGSYLRTFTDQDVQGLTPDGPVRWERILGQFSIVDNYLIMTEQSVHRSVLIFDISDLKATGKLVYAGELLRTPNYIWNTVTNEGIASPFGLAVSRAHGQVFISDGLRVLVWSNSAPYAGRGADFVIGQPDFSTKQADAWPGFIFKDKVGGLAIDDINGKLWVSRGLEVYAFDLPIQINSPQPSDTLISRIPNSPWLGNLPVKGHSENLIFESKAVAFDPLDQTLWIVDNLGSRVVQVTNPYTSPRVNLIVGQYSATSRTCNHGNPTMPTAQTLCLPGSAAFDRLGNLYIAEGVYEGSSGNKRIVQYDRTTIKAAQQAGLLSEPAADRVYAVPSFTTNPRFESGFSCLADTPCNPIAISFDSRNRMLVTTDSYFNGRNRRIFIYHNPLKNKGFVNFNPTQDTILPYSVGQGAFSDYDASEKLYLLDHTWNRVLVVDILPDAIPNTPPVLATIWNRYAYQGKVLRIKVSATDQEMTSQTLLYSLAPGAPETMHIDPATGLISWPVNSSTLLGQHPVTVNVMDSGSPPLSDSETFTVTVNSPNRVGNHSFETGGKVAKAAAGWATQGLTKNDRRICDTLTKSHAFEGTCAYRFTRVNATTVNRFITRQIAQPDFKKGDIIILRVATKADKLTKGARVSLEVTYRNSQRRNVRINIPEGTYPYQTFWTLMTVDRAVKAMRVKVETQRSTGTFFVDDIAIVGYEPAALSESIGSDLRGSN
jgi:hypothetical protein